MQNTSYSLRNEERSIIIFIKNNKAKYNKADIHKKTAFYLFDLPAYKEQHMFVWFRDILWSLKKNINNFEKVTV